MPLTLTGRPMRQLRVFGRGLLSALFILVVEGGTEDGVMTWLGYFCLAMSLLIIAGIAVSLLRPARPGPAHARWSWPDLACRARCGPLPMDHAGRPLNRRIVGYDWSVQNVWDCSNDELLGTLNRYLTGAVGPGTPTTAYGR
jgi:hypothetical protein